MDSKTGLFSDERRESAIVTGVQSGESVVRGPGNNRARNFGRNIQEGSSVRQEFPETSQEIYLGYVKIPNSTRNPISNDDGNVSKFRNLLELDNFSPKKDLIKFNKKDAFNLNLEVLKLLNLLYQEKRNPNNEEKIVLSNYYGWGGLKEILLDVNDSIKPY